MLRPSWLSLLFALVLATGAESQVASISRADRVQYYLHRTYSWQRLSWLATDTAIDHLLKEPEWGRGPGGYGCQFASGFGRRVVGNSVELGVGLLLNENIGFHPSQLEGFFPRIRYAASHAFLASVPGGAIHPAYARFAGIASTAMIAPSWHRQTLSGSGFFSEMGFSAMDQVQNSLLTEFSPDLRRFGAIARKKLFSKLTASTP